MTAPKKPESTYDYWNRLCKLPKSSFIIANGGVKRVTDSTGNWIEYSAAQAIVDDAQLRITELEAKLAGQPELPEPVAPSATPVLYASPEQLEAFKDKGPRHGAYLPLRRTPVGKFTQPLYTAAAQLQQARASASQGVPAGFALVPLTPTPAMLEAALRLTADMAMDGDEPYHIEIYAAMVAAKDTQ